MRVRRGGQGDAGLKSLPSHTEAANSRLEQPVSRSESPATRTDTYREDEMDKFETLETDFFKFCKRLAIFVETHRELIAERDKLQWDVGECRKQLKKEQADKALKHVQGGNNE